MLVQHHRIPVRVVQDQAGRTSTAAGFALDLQPGFPQPRLDLPDIGERGLGVPLWSQPGLKVRMLPLNIS